MCNIKEGVTVEQIRQHLRDIADQLEDTPEVKGTYVVEDHYQSVTVVLKHQVMSFNFMDWRKEADDD